MSKFDVLIAWREDRLYRGITSAVVELKEAVRARDSPLRLSMAASTFIDGSLGLVCRCGE